MKKLGFTLVEVLVVVAIFLVLVGLMFPVFASVKREANTTRCISNLRQMHLATMLYRSEYDGDGKYGTFHEMGLPVELIDLYELKRIPLEVFRCKGTVMWAGRPMPNMNGFYLYQLKPYDKLFAPEWEQDAKRLGDQIPLIVDDGHDFPGREQLSPSVLHRALLGRLDGSIARPQGYGDSTQYSFWIKL